MNNIRKIILSVIQHGDECALEMSYDKDTELWCAEISCSGKSGYCPIFDPENGEECCAAEAPYAAEAIDKLERLCERWAQYLDSFATREGA